MFKGSFKFSIDGKGRVSFPAKLRKSMEPAADNTFVLIPGSEKCIDAYPLDQWKVFEEKLDSLNMFDPEESSLVRRILQDASEEHLDSQNRLLIPKHLKDYANIGADVVILGVLKKIEIWDPVSYENYLSRQSMPLEQATSKVFGKKKTDAA